MDYQRILFAMVLSLSISIDSSTSSEWNYHEYGPDVWSEINPTCAGLSQSPINIRNKCATFKAFSDWNISMDYNASRMFSLKNNGHGIVAELKDTTSSPLLLSGGGLDSTYQFVNFHLHWGENHASGSEHQM
jgi:carbonic anhydrase